MGALFCKCCCPCENLHYSNNSVGVLTEPHFKVLLLGPTGSGKTEVAHLLSKAKRNDFEPTNGSKFYPVEISMDNGVKQSMGLTEIGGNIEMQRLWHHYFAGTMAIIYCFDMSAGYEILCATFQLLDQVLSHSFISGKSILLIGTKSDLVYEGLQMYDIENTFQLAAMANKYDCSLRMCHLDREDELKELQQGIIWLAKSIKMNYGALKVRIKGDSNMKAWNEQTQKLIAAGKLKRWSYRRFPNRRTKRQAPKMFWKYGSPRVAALQRRPNTAPSTVFTISFSSRDNIISWHNSDDTVDTTATAL